MEWISVTERLPEKYESVLCYNKGHITNGLWNSFHKCWHWCNHNNTGKIKKKEVTHWMPRPAPPKK